MTERVHFKLAYNGETHKFASTLHDDRLFRAVQDKVADTVKGKGHELFWRDDDSDVVLETSDDLATAIEYAKATRTDPAKPPCLLLSVQVHESTESEATSVQQERPQQTETAGAAAAEPETHQQGAEAAAVAASATQAAAAADAATEPEMQLPEVEAAAPAAASSTKKDEPACRKRFTPEQGEILQEAYNLEPYPTSSQVISLALKLDSKDPVQIAVWFFNRRVKDNNKDQQTALRALKCLFMFPAELEAKHIIETKYLSTREKFALLSFMGKTFKGVAFTVELVERCIQELTLQMSEKPDEVVDNPTEVANNHKEEEQIRQTYAHIPLQDIEAKLNLHRLEKTERKIREIGVEFEEDESKWRFTPRQEVTLEESFWYHGGNAQAARKDNLVFKLKLNQDQINHWFEQRRLKQLLSDKARYEQQRLQMQLQLQTRPLPMDMQPQGSCKMQPARDGTPIFIYPNGCVGPQHPFYGNLYQRLQQHQHMVRMQQQQQQAMAAAAAAAEGGPLTEEQREDKVMKVEEEKKEKHEKKKDSTADRERELRIREKALELKEEAFERRMAEYAVKMEEYDEKMKELEERVKGIEEENMENIEERMDGMEERLVKIEEGMDDMVIM